jgi:hypothetical protein
MVEFSDRLIGDIECIARRVSFLAKIFELEIYADIAELPLQERVPHYAQLRECILSALSEKAIWSVIELNVLKSKLMKAERMYYGGICTLALKAAEKRFKETDDPEVAIAACVAAALTLKETLTKGKLWSFEEKRELHAIAAKFKLKKRVTEKEFTDLIHQARQLLSRERNVYGNQRAGKDIAAAKDLYKKERSKWFNWKWMGHPRDDIHNLYRAARLSQRAKSSQYASMTLRYEAAKVFNEIIASMSDKELKGLDSYPELSGYSFMWDFPNWDPVVKARKAWGVNRNLDKDFKSRKM